MATGTYYDLWEDISTDCLLNDDIWDKFQLSNLDISGVDWFLGLDDPKYIDGDIAPHTTCAGIKCDEDTKMRNHDCMWAGHCGSKEHSVDDIKNFLVKPISMMFQPAAPSAPVAAAAPTPAVAPVVSKQTAIAPGRSLLLKTQPQHQQQIYLQQQQATTNATTTPLLESQTPSGPAASVLPYYESPPNSDDEETKSSVLQYLQEYISECDLDDDDLVDYFKDFEGEADPEIVESKQQIQQKQQAPKIKEEPAQEKTSAQKSRSETLSRFVNDHCYHKDKNASMRMPETPSDSEEEIDVVSTDDKHINPQRTVSALPTNPTTRDRQQIQKTMASAITKNGIGIRMIQRKPSSGSSGSAEHSPSKRRADAPRGIKRNRHRMPISPYKKQRAYQVHQLSSDSEQEPSEKRIEHNNMERQRRVDLRNAFEELRVLVPEVSKRERAPKVVILREAAVHCHKLTDVSDSMKRQVEEMRRQQRRLRTRLSQLRLSLAPKHQ